MRNEASPKNPAAGEEMDLLEQLPNLRKPRAGDVPVAGVIDPLVREGELYDRLDRDWVYCYACGHRCKFRRGRAASARCGTISAAN
ncbi:MAG: hypothetical protein Q9P14_09815 [candidate division KSB1 bacterium]|nr:hypothetical protein [candidate division KSB1 bacterium]